MPPKIMNQPFTQMIGNERLQKRGLNREKKIDKMFWNNVDVLS
jgi:hypothetical protein